MISRRDKARVTNANQASMLSVENSHNSSPKKIIKVKDRWERVRVTMDSGAAGHFMIEAMFPTCETRAQDSTKEVSGSEW